MEEKTDFIKPFKNLWPKYKLSSELIADYDSLSMISYQGLPTLL